MNELVSEKEEKTSRLATVNVALAFLGLLTCGALYYSIILKALPLWVLAPLILAGVFVLQRRLACQRELIRLWNVADYYEKAVARLSRKWESLDPGDGFADQNHFYSADLDLFGQGSLYQLLCSARTQMGRETLANWMRAPATVEEIRIRQAAVSELRERRDLPESLATAGKTQASDCRPELLKSWAAAPSTPFPAWSRPLAFVLAIAAPALPILFWLGLLDLHRLFVSAVALLAIQGLFAQAFRSEVKQVLESLGPLSIELPIVHELL
ncbi:MAG TPA: hypothetical protein VJW93_12700, partial [Candidatus Acidoferrales bacterium]|nr:hypothetical protein [Candidatus Acidoferrales bacterium]